MKSKRLRAFDRVRMKPYRGLIGVDEAGRGALAGPVVAAAVAARHSFYDSEWCKRNASRINDSKLLSAEERETLYERFRWLEKRGRVFIGVGRGSVDEIEDLNILGATQIAMRRALEEAIGKAGVRPRDPDPLFVAEEDPANHQESLAQWRIFVDGKPMKALGFDHDAYVNGDSRSLCIAMASVVAKVTRDRLMLTLDCEYPHYDLASSKGYATPGHRDGILRGGPTPEHRTHFLRKLLESDGEDDQGEFGF